LVYRTARREQEARLIETARSQARLIEAIARFDTRQNPTDQQRAKAATLSQIIDAHRHYQGFGKTGEFTLARKQSDMIEFILSHRHLDLDTPRPVPFNSNFAEPMRLALSGKSGTIIGLDYRGELVLAAFEPVELLGLGIVAKIDMAEIREPFVRAGLICGVVGILAIIVGSLLFVRITEPLVRTLQETVTELQQAMTKVKQLSGLLPICVSCKKIRDDTGYWNQIEAYVKTHSEAEFTHGICPECARKLYGDLAEEDPHKD
jgi:hypothetical protein